ncbi:hypothetical protein CDL15_Pgr020870 [Punica granatum]|uniref:Peptide methionine sulfoxide reductase A5 n=1 Tax=Punica granatum TaxID=22663 RepID=A0A218XW94_PUNGR|nr:hypothetical protein CDL15_Pgr020870 [Punica granatum]
MSSSARSVFPLILLMASFLDGAQCIRFLGRISEQPKEPPNQSLKTAVFALGSFWRSEAVFGCLHGVVRTTAGYAGGSKTNPEYRSLGNHAESVQVEYDPRLISYRQLLEVFWSSHDSRQVFGQGPDVGSQYRSVIFVNGTEESRLAAFSKEREQTKSKSSVVTTQIQQIGTFYPAEPEHQANGSMAKILVEYPWAKQKKVSVVRDKASMIVSKSPQKVKAPEVLSSCVTRTSGNKLESNANSKGSCPKPVEDTGIETANYFDVLDDKDVTQPTNDLPLSPERPRNAVLEFNQMLQNITQLQRKTRKGSKKNEVEVTGNAARDRPIHLNSSQ